MTHRHTFSRLAAGLLTAAGLSTTAIAAQPFTFDDPSEWYSAHGDPIELSATAHSTDGDGALSIPLNGYTRIRSVPFTPAVSEPANQWDLDVFIPSDQEGWVSYVEVVVRVASAQMYWNVIDQVNVRKLTRGEYHTVTVADVPQDVQNLLTTATDFELIINMNGQATGASWVLDNLRFSDTAADDAPPPSLPPSTSGLGFGDATRYNAFIDGDFSGFSSDVQGRLAASGDVELSHYSIGFELPRDDADYSLVVGGELEFEDGGSVREGSVITGEEAEIDDVILIARSGATVEEYQSDLPVNFQDTMSQIRSNSFALRNRDQTGTATVAWGRLWLEGDGSSDVQVFNMNAADGLEIGVIEVENVPPNAHIIINLIGNGGFTAINNQALAPYTGKLLFNFTDATEVVLDRVSLKGAVMAPYAVIQGTNGSIDGNVAAIGFTGNMQINEYPFTPVREGGVPTL